MITENFRRLWRHFLSDNLFRNSVYLMLSTVVSGGLGFFFWLICTHIYSPEQIGVGTALISAMSLISTIGLLGFNSTFVRVLPTSQNRNNEINTGSILVIGISAIMAAVYVLLIPFTAPSLSVINQNFWYAAGFVIIVALASINSLSDSVFIAYRSAQYALITDAFITSGAKLLLPLVFVALGAYGVFFSAGLATSLGMIGSILYMMFVFGYKPHLKIDMPTLRDVFRYSFTNYVANLLNMIPALILPIIVLDRLGAPAAAYYYLAFMIINLIYTVANSVAQSPPRNCRKNLNIYVPLTCKRLWRYAGRMVILRHAMYGSR
jgi:O-antigen/teichoic acid export membrane protein